MRMYFRTFGDFECPPMKHYYDRPFRDEPKFLHHDLIPDDLGRGIMYSKEIDFNSRCRNNGFGYHEYYLRDHDNWRKFFEEMLMFMCGYMEIGCATFSVGDGDEHKSFIVTEHANLNAYSSYSKNGGTNPFFIIFNAMPTKERYNNFLRVGYDRYPVACNQKSVIVWNLDDYIDMPCLKDFTIWGIKHDAMGASRTNDILVGVKNGEFVYA